MLYVVYALNVLSSTKDVYVCIAMLSIILHSREKTEQKNKINKRQERLNWNPLKTLIRFQTKALKIYCYYCYFSWCCSRMPIVTWYTLFFYSLLFSSLTLSALFYSLSCPLIKRKEMHRFKRLGLTNYILFSKRLILSLSLFLFEFKTFMFGK